MASTNEAWVTLATTDAYALGAMVVAASLRRVGTTRKLHVLITDSVGQAMRQALHASFDEVSVVNVLDSKDEANLRLIGRPDLGVTFTKLHCWRLTQYTKAVFLDADTLIVRNCDELFARDELSAAPDVGWPDCFNSGVFVFVPSNATYAKLVELGVKEGSFDGGDQGLLNAYFSDWRERDVAYRLPFTFNMSSSIAYTYAAAHKRFTADVRIVHFLGAVKPWQHGVGADGRVMQRQGTTYSNEHLQLWWDVCRQVVLPKLDEAIAGALGNVTPHHRSLDDLVIVERAPAQTTSLTAFAGMHIAATAPSASTTDGSRQAAWEAGHIDYEGADAWSHIQAKLDEAMRKKK